MWGFFGGWGWEGRRGAFLTPVLKFATIQNEPKRAQMK